MSSQNHAQPSSSRESIYAELGLTPYLAQRELLQLGSLPLHAELYHYAPSAPCVVFVPGIGTYSELYAESLAKLALRGFNVVGVDLRGHGYSGGERGDYSVAEVVGDLQHVVDYLEQRYNSAITLVGCSIGSRLALALCEADERIRALFCHTLLMSELAPDLFHSVGWANLSITAMWMPSAKVNFRTFIDLQSLLDNHPMGRFALQDDLMVWEYTVRTLDSVYNQPSRAYTTPLDIPAVVVVGDLDTIVRPSYIRELIDQAAQPFDYIEIENAGHMLPLENVDQWVETCAQWLKSALLGSDTQML
ncbi:alpha/beta hydrolase [Vibrio sp. WXL210]|uniref:alpha/beta hydrolase n=1 Tax=Vibrio sp. WXL210 TaxID=3450709 RepID=UPI003EC62EC5